ncbi:MAG: hypothetical protein QW758_01805 [Candidatus Aenigmatarchaeota archaeon]
MNIEEAIKLYEKVGYRKGADFLFKWLYNVYQNVYLPSIDMKYKDTLAIDKTKLTIFDVLIDDLADNCKARNKELLEEFAQIPWKSVSKYENDYLEVGRKIWNDCITSIKSYPRYEELSYIFFFDLHQVINSMRYSFLVNTLDIENEIENEIYLHHGCMVILHCDMDLMCSKDFDLSELKNIRVIFYLAQKVASIGNMLNTYPREVIERDFSSPIISLAIRKGLITKNLDDNDIKKLKRLEVLFINRAKSYIQKVRKLEEDIKSINIKGFSNKLEWLLNSFINRKRYWEE